MTRHVYLDYNGSTPIAPEVAAVMYAAIDDAFGNPSSQHWAGAPARRAVEKARGQVANLLGCAPEEVVFTSGGSESNNLALKGVFFASTRAPAHHHDANRTSGDRCAMPFPGTIGR